MNATAPVDRDLLSELEDRWRSQRAPVLDHLRLGLSADEIEAVVSTLGVSAPAEAVTWWSCHDGADAPGARLIAPKGFQLVPVADAVAATQRSRDIMAAAWADVRDVAPEDVWDPAWLVLLTDGDQQATIECDVSPRSPSPVRLMFFEQARPGAREPRARSIRELVTWWIEAMDSGAMYFDPTMGVWHSRPELLPLDRRESGLV